MDEVVDQFAEHHSAVCVLVLVHRVRSRRLRSRFQILPNSAYPKTQGEIQTASAGVKCSRTHAGDEVHGHVAPHCSGSDPDQNQFGVAKDVSHSIDVPAFFLLVGLVDTDGVDPELLFHLMPAELCQGGVQVDPDWERFVVDLDLDHSGWSYAPPNIRDRGVGSLVVH